MILIKKSKLSAVATLFVLASGLQAAEPVWTGGGPLPPANTEVKALAELPTGKLLGGTKSGGVFISDAGVTKWEKQAFGLTDGDGQDAKSLLVLSDGSALVGTKDGVFRSTNGGIDFANSSTGIPVTLEDRDVRYLVQDPYSTAGVYLATKGGVYVSTDAGLSWMERSNGLESLDQQDVKVVAPSPANSDVFISTKVGLYKSSDIDNTSWTLACADSANAEVKALAHNSNGSVLYAYVKGKGTGLMALSTFLRSEDGGTTFTAIPLPNNAEVGEQALVPDGSDPNSLLVGDKQGKIYLSTDKGETWIKVAGSPVGNDIKVILRDKDAPSTTFYVGARDGFYKSTNSGASWTAHNNGLIATAAESKHVLVDPSNAMAVYVGTKSGLWFTSQGATTVGTGWTELSQSISTLFNLDTRRVLIDRAADPSGNTIYIAGKYDLFKTTDRGASWFDASNGVSLPEVGVDKDIKFIMQDPANPGVLYMSRKLLNSAGEIGEIYRSSNGGTNWTKISDDLQFAYTVEGFEPDPKVMTIVGSTLFVGTKEGLYKSSTGGNLPLNFTFANDGITTDSEDGRDIKTIEVNNDGTRMAVGTKNGAFISTDGGNTWISISGNLPSENPLDPNANVEVEGLYFDTYGRLWAGSKKNGVYYTIDPVSGNWVSASAGLPAGKAQEIVHITSAPSEPSRFYLGTKAGTFAATADPSSSVIEWQQY